MTNIRRFIARIQEITLRNDLIAAVSSQHIMLIAISILLYVPFLIEYGWKYIGIPNVDLPSFYAASVNVFRHGGSPYDLVSLQRLMPAGTRVFPYLYPPPSLLFFSPLSALTYPQARHALLLINHLLYAFLMWIIPFRILQLTIIRSFSALVFCFIYSINFYPVVIALNTGQIDILCLTLLVLFWTSANDRRTMLASAFLAVAIVLKTYPIIIIPMLLLMGRWREGLYTAFWVGLAVLVSVVLLPHAIWHDWLTEVAPTGGYAHTPAGLFSPAGIWNQSLNGFFARHFTASEWSHPIIINPRLSGLLTYGSATLATAATCLAIWLGRLNKDILDRMMIVALPLIYLVAPFSWEHHLVFLIPSTLMLLRGRLPGRRPPKVAFFGLWFLAALLIAAPYVLQYKFYGVVILWGLGLFVAGSSRVQLGNQITDVDRQMSTAPLRG